jgi:hypothetical protein
MRQSRKTRSPQTFGEARKAINAYRRQGIPQPIITQFSRMLREVEVSPAMLLTWYCIVTPGEPRSIMAQLLADPAPFTAFCDAWIMAERGREFIESVGVAA